MAKSHETESSIRYNGSDIVTMRIGGYLGVMPYKQFPDLDAADNRAANVGRRYLGERAAQSDLAKFVKENPNSSHAERAAHVQAFLAAFQVPVGGASEFTTVDSMRADVAKEYLCEKFHIDESTEEGRATWALAVQEGKLTAALNHPRIGAEIEARLAAKLSEYVAPKSREAKGGTVDPSKGRSLDLDAA